MRNFSIEDNRAATVFIETSSSINVIRTVNPLNRKLNSCLKSSPLQMRHANPSRIKNIIHFGTRWPLLVSPTRVSNIDDTADKTRWVADVWDTKEKLGGFVGSQTALVTRKMKHNLGRGKCQDAYLSLLRLKQPLRWLKSSMYICSTLCYRKAHTRTPVHD